MPDQLFTPQFWNAQWAVVMSAPWLTIPLLLLAGLVGLFLQWWRDGTLRERLSLANDQRAVVTRQITKLEAQIAEVRVDVANIKGSRNLIPGLDKVASTTAVLSYTVRVLQAANSSLGSTLTGSGGLTADATVVKATSKSE
jgi:hypothetical protein